MIDIRNYDFARGELSVNGVTFEVCGGEVLGLVGASGSGKTSLITSIVSRSPLFGSADKFSVPDAEKPIGLVTQENTLFDWLSVEDNIFFFSDASKRNSEAQKIIYDFGITKPMLLRDAKNLSGGEKRRVAILRSLFTSTTLQIFDEAFTGLDFSIKAKVLSFIVHYCLKENVAVVCVSHDPITLFSICSKVVSMPTPEGEPMKRFELSNKTEYRGIDDLKSDKFSEFSQWFVGAQGGQKANKI